MLCYKYIKYNIMKTLEPVNNFYTVTVSYPVETSSGKIKKVKEGRSINERDSNK